MGLFRQPQAGDAGEAECTGQVRLLKHTVAECLETAFPAIPGQVREGHLEEGFLAQSPRDELCT